MAVPRILMLPGFTQNAAIFSGRMGALRRSLKDSAEFVFVDPPHIVAVTGSSADFDSSATETPQTPEETPRAWWFYDSSDPEQRYNGLEESLRHLRGILEQQGPFDAVWGFSQGAAVAAVLTALVENTSRHPIFAVPATSATTNWPPKPFKFAVLSAGFLPLDPALKVLFSDGPAGPRPKTPTLHVLGRGDTLVSEERSVPLTKGFVDARVEWHDGGHHTPSKASWRTFFKSYVELFVEGGLGAAGIAGIPSPSSGVDSGTATPTGSESTSGRL